VDPIRIGEGYYLAPSGQVAAKPYKLLRMALDRSSKVAVAKYAWSGRKPLGLLRVRDDMIVLHAMRWPDEIRSPEELLPPPVELSDEEIDGALALMDSMPSDDLVGDEFHDAYTEAVEQIIEAKREHREPPKLEEPEEKTGQLVDLNAALNESVQKARTAPRRRRRRPRAAEEDREEATGQEDHREEDHEESRCQEDVRTPGAQRLAHDWLCSSLGALAQIMWSGCSPSQYLLRAGAQSVKLSVSDGPRGGPWSTSRRSCGPGMSEVASSLRPHGHSD
jgi:hypothetical protein